VSRDWAGLAAFYRFEPRKQMPRASWPAGVVVSFFFFVPLFSASPQGKVVYDPLRCISVPPSIAPSSRTGRSTRLCSTLFLPARRRPTTLTGVMFEHLSPKCRNFRTRPSSRHQRPAFTVFHFFLRGRPRDGESSCKKIN